MTSAAITNGGFTLQLRSAPRVAPLLERLLKFLSPHFRPCAHTAKTDFTLALHPPGDFTDHHRRLCGERLLLRRSSASIFNLEVLLGVSSDRCLLAFDEARNVGYRINRATAHVDFYGEDNAFIHLIELVRYYGLLVEQSRGTAVLHSAAVIDGDSVTAIIGAKGAGKTTTMLSLLDAGEGRYFSGDKVLIDLVEGRVRARSWPDFPHIGIGTLRQHTELAGRLDVSLTDVHGASRLDSDKVLIEPERFLANIPTDSRGAGWLERLILPDVNGPGDGRSIAVSTPAKSGMTVDGWFEWPHRFLAATWHGLSPSREPIADTISPALKAALYQLPWERRSGKNSNRTVAAGMSSLQVGAN